MSFISLRQFLLLQEDIVPDHPREFTERIRVEATVEWYELAKRSFEQFGADGPPIGSEVICILAGHGGGPGSIRRFDGIYAPDSRYFAVSRKAPPGSGRERCCSLVTRHQWWREICVFSIENENTVDDIYCTGRTRHFKVENGAPEPQLNMNEQDDDEKDVITDILTVPEKVKEPKHRYGIDLTAIQKEILETIKHSIQTTGRPISKSGLATMFGVKRQTMGQYIQAIIKKGHLVQPGDHSTLSLPTSSAA